jgi:hypothetical protein
MSLVDRAKNMIMKPAAEWPVIAMEPATPASLYTSYIVPLAAIPAVCSLVSSFVILHNPIVAVVGAVMSYVLTLVLVFVIALIAGALAPSFGGVNDRLAGLKLASYGYTPSWVAGIFLLIPFVGGIFSLIGGLYSLYVIYLGIGPLMRVPPDKLVGYAVVLLLCVIVVAAIVGFATAAVVTALAIGSAAATGQFSH